MDSTEPQPGSPTLQRIASGGVATSGELETPTTLSRTPSRILTPPALPIPLPRQSSTSRLSPRPSPRSSSSSPRPSRASSSTSVSASSSSSTTSSPSPTLSPTPSPLVSPPSFKKIPSLGLSVSYAPVRTSFPYPFPHQEGESSRRPSLLGYVQSNVSELHFPTYKPKPKRSSKLMRMVFGSVGSLFILVLVLSVTGTGFGVWGVYQQMSDKPISEMSTEVRRLTVMSVLDTLDVYFGNVESTLSRVAYLMRFGGAPYFFEEPDIVQASKMVWASMQQANLDSNLVWIMNAFAGLNRTIGYSRAANEWAWLGNWDGSIPGGQWQIRIGDQIDNITGAVNFTAPPLLNDDLGWPEIYKALFHPGSPKTLYIFNNPHVDLVNPYYPELGIQLTLVHGFVASGVDCMVTATFPSSFLTERLKSIRTRGGVVYLANDDGLLMATSAIGEPVYSVVVDGVTNYRLFSYANYPDDVVQRSGALIKNKFGSFERIPIGITLNFMDIDGSSWTITTATFQRQNFNVHIVTCIPDSSFVGFTHELQLTLTWVVVVIVLGVSGIAIFLVLVLITRPINKEIRKLNAWVNADERDPDSLFYKSTRTCIEKKYPQARDEVTSMCTAPSSVRTISVVVEQTMPTPLQGLVRKVVRSLSWFGRKFAPYEVQELREASKTSRNAMKSFSAYIPRSVVRTLVETREVAKPNMMNRNLSIYFSDIEDYTGIVGAFNNDPALINEMINDYVGEMTVVLERNKGTVDKWIGDGIMAFWNAPVAIRNHPFWAVTASFQCERRLEYLMREWSVKGFPSIRIRHGFHMGDAYVGNIGGEGRMSFTAIGESVNIAARIEGLNKRYGTYRLCTEAMYEQIAPHFLCRLMENVAVKGTTRLMRVYEIVAPDDVATDYERQRVAEYTEATEEFIGGGKEGWQYALSLYTQYRERYAKHVPDVGLELMIKQCKDYLQNPPERWAGGIILEEK